MRRLGMRTTAWMAGILALVVVLAAGRSWGADGNRGDATTGVDAPSTEKFELHGIWMTQSSCEDKTAGDAISKVGYVGKGWHKAEVPGTVVGALVEDKTLADPNYGMNMKSWPGMNYSSKSFFANQDMPAGSPYRCSFWFRMEFESPKEYEGRRAWLTFLGINYRANVWLNGEKIADRADVAGPYRTFAFDISKQMKKGAHAQNALAVEVFAPEKNDLGLTWVDWNPTPPDKDMGMWREVVLTSTGDAVLKHPLVLPKLDATYSKAELKVSADVWNASDHAVNARVDAQVIAGLTLFKQVQLAAGETKRVTFTADEFAQLKLEHPKLWWPYQMGEPHLYDATIRVNVDEKPSDEKKFQYGIREVTSELTGANGESRLFKVNGKRVLIRGAAWAPDMMLRWSSRKLDTDLAYTRDMGLNTIRLEGKVDREEFFEKTDKLGILVMPGWICCDAWEMWKNWTPETKKIAAASLVDQIARLRNHASVFVWLYGSDGPPPADIENMYLGILKDLEWPNPSISSASAEHTKVTGKSGVKMTGPYEYVPPMYWLADKKAGGAWSYNTETSPGPAIPPKESLVKFIPQDHLWPIDEYWNFHAGGERFTTINVFRNALDKRYGTAKSLDDFLRKSQAMTYDEQRAMFEAYGRNKYTSTGVIQWMLNNAWPSLIWHLYDYYQVPAGGYFGTKKATEIVHVQYGYDDNTVDVVNGLYDPLPGMKVTAKVFNIDGKEVASKEATVDVPADGAVKAFEVPAAAGISTTYFVKLWLTDSSGKAVSENFYWLSTKADTMDWKKKKDTVYTPQKEFADLTALEGLAEANVEVVSSLKAGSDEKWMASVKVKNAGSGVAFMVRARVVSAETHDDYVPVIWNENYVTLMPGEERELRATFDRGVSGGTPALIVDGFNLGEKVMGFNEVKK
jgi:exo-1,4-beta-D-glucosaminidase